MDNEKYKKRAIKKSFIILEKATELAVEHRDVESMLAISDRWTMFAEILGDSSLKEIPIGFIGQEKNDREDKASHKRKG